MRFASRRLARSASVPPMPRSLNPPVAGNVIVELFRAAAMLIALTLILLVPAPRVIVPLAPLLVEALLRFMFAAVI